MDPPLPKNSILLGDVFDKIEMEIAAINEENKGFGLKMMHLTSLLRLESLHNWAYNDPLQRLTQWSEFESNEGDCHFPVSVKEILKTYLKDSPPYLDISPTIRKMKAYGVSTDQINKDLDTTYYPSTSGDNIHK